MYITVPPVGFADTCGGSPSSLFSLGGLCSVKGKVGLKVFPVCLLTLAVDLRRHFSVWEDYVLLKQVWVSKYSLCVC